MKKIAPALTIAFFSILGSSLPAAHAQQIFQLNGLAKETDIQPQIFVIMSYLLSGAFFLAVAGIVIGGFLYVTSAGNEGRSEKAKTAITSSIIGLVVILLAYTIVATLNTIFIH